MSVETKPIVDKNVTPNPAISESAVADAGNYVLKNGDALDQLRRFKRVRSLGPIASVGALYSGVYMGYFYTTVGTIPGRVGVIAATAGVAALAGPFVRNREQRKAQAVLDQQEKISAKVGTKVEIYQYKEDKLGKREKHLDLRWYGFTDQEANPAQLKEQLTQVAIAGKELNAKRFVLPFDQVESFLPADEETGDLYTQSEWLQETKKRDIVDEKHENDELLVVTAPELAKIIEGIETLENNQPLHAIMQLLHKVAPSHPSHDWYKHYAGNPQVIEKQLEKVFRTSFERNLEDVHSRRTLDEDFVPGRKRIYSTGKVTLSGETPLIEWRGVNEWTHTNTTNFLEHKHITPDDFVDVLTKPHEYTPERVAEVCEVAAWLTIKEVAIGLGEGEGIDQTHQVVTTDESETDTLPLQQRVVEEEAGTKRGLRRNTVKHGINLRKTSIGRRVGRSAAMLAASFGLGFGIGEHQEYEASRVIDRTEQLQASLAEERGVPSYEIDFLEVFEEAEKENLVYQTYDTVFGNPLNEIDGLTSNLVNNILVQAGLQYAPQEIQEFVTQNTQEQDCITCDAPVGNVTNTPNRPVWYVESMNGMNSEGYWAERVLEVVDFEGMQWTAQSNYRNDERDAIIADAQPLPVPEQLDMTQPMVRVQRAIEFGYSEATSNFTPYEFTHATDEILVTVPLLEGTRIAGAILEDDIATRVVSFKDGTQGLIIPRVSGPMTLEYWLTPDADAEVSAIGPIRPNDEVRADQVEPVWEDHLGYQLPDDPQERLEFQESYIRNEFSYRLAPIRDPQIVFDRTRYAEDVLRYKEANCNVANSLLAISNPENLNAVTGYRNTNSDPSGRQYLSGSEQHLWTVDRDGSRYDATPGGLLPEEAAHFEEDFGGKGLENPARERQDAMFRILMGAGLVTAAGFAYWKRRRIRQGYEAFDAWTADMQLQSLSTKKLMEGYAAFNHIQFAGPDFALADSLQIKPAFPGIDVSRESTLAGFKKYIDEDTLQARMDTLREAQATTPNRKERRAIKRAKRILSLLDKSKSRTNEDVEEQE